MTLLQRIEAVVQVASQAEVVERRAAVAETTDEVATQVRELRQRLVAATARHAELKAYAIGGADWPDSRKAVAAVADYHRAFQANPEGGKAEFRRMVSALTKVVLGAEQSVTAAIVQCRKSLREDGRPLDDLGSVEGFVEQVSAAKRDLESLLAQDWQRADGQFLAQLLVRRAELQKRLDSLTRVDVPKAVRTFFREARGTGARLDLLTDEVLMWLEENGQRDRVRLVIR